MTKEEKIQKILKIVPTYLGKRYKKGARAYQAPEVFNCSSFTKFIFDHVGKKLPVRAVTQATRGRGVSQKNIKPGDLIFIRSRAGYYNSKFPEGIGHVAIYLGDDEVISARSRYGGVVKEPLKNYLKKEQFRTIRRLI